MRGRKFLPRFIGKRLDLLDKLARLDELSMLPTIAESLARVEGRQLEGRHGSLAEHEFKVYSHAGEDGIIQYLVGAIQPMPRTFVEFGVEDYLEANTRLLLINDHWSGLVMDGSSANVARIRADPIYWNSTLQAVTAFVTRENVNDLLVKHGSTGEIGLLSVDVDGNDYWIFDAIDVATPAIAIAEYNHRFGPSLAVTVPYNAGFVRRRTDASWLFAGASLKAMVIAARAKGLAFVGCNSFGNNAFFVRENVRPSWLPSLSAEDGFVPGRFRESMIRDGYEWLPTADEERALLRDVELVTVS